MARRIKRFHLSPHQVAQAFDHSGPPHVHVEGLPDGHRILYCDFDVKRQTFRFVAEHESFDDVPEGDDPGELQVNLTVLE